MHQKFTLLFLLALAFQSCLRELDFPSKTDDRQTLVVDGGLTNGGFPQRIRLFHPAKNGVLKFDGITGAAVTILEENGPSESLVERTDSLGNPFYELAGSVLKPTAGHAYSIEIRLTDGKTYRSKPEIMPETVKMDSIFVKGERVETANEFDILFKKNYAAVFADATRPADGRTGWLRWDAYATYQFNELQLPTPIPPPTHQCYVWDFFMHRDNRLALQNLENVAPNGHFSTRLGQKEADFSFELRQVFTVIQYTLPENAGRYWERVQELTTKNGSILDTPPAAVASNVFNEKDENERVLGYFEVDAVDTARISVYNGQLPNDFYIAKYCEILYDFQGGYHYNFNECANCLLLKNSSYAVPWFW